MRKQELMLTGKMDKYAHIFDNMAPVESEFKSISEDDQHAQILTETSNKLSEFFGFNVGSMDEFATSFVEQHSEELKDTYENSIVKEDTLSARTEKENEKRFQDSQFIFQRRVAESKNLTEPDWSKSTDYVMSQSEPGYGEKLSNNRFKEMERLQTRTAAPAGFGQQTARPASTGFDNAYRNPGTGTTTTNKQTTQNNEPRSAMDAFSDMNAEVQKVGRQRIKGWNTATEEEMGYFEAYAHNTPWWKKSLRKAKSFVKGKKGKITLKVGMLLALNMGMAVFSKRYKFEDGKQMAAMFAFMMTSFFITRELSEEGIELGGFGF